MSEFRKWGLCLLLTCGAFGAFGQKAMRIPLEKAQLQPVNRKIELLSDAQKGRVLKVNALANPGVVWINGLSFEQGTIAFDVKGKDVLQESFVGIAFHGTSDEHYEAVYFRPFNFNARDSVRKAHAVQYMALPNYDWPYLRKKFSGKYEAPMTSFIDPDSWFHVKVVVDAKLISVFVNESDQPVLSISPLEKPAKGKLGFWLGHGSDGAFSNLVVTGGQWTTN